LVYRLLCQYPILNVHRCAHSIFIFGIISELITGLRVVDSILPVGRGQRQLILGDRYTGKTSIFLSLLITLNRLNFLVAIDGFGTKRLFGIYIGMNQNLSKLSKLISSIVID